MSGSVLAVPGFDQPVPLAAVAAIVRELQAGGAGRWQDAAWLERAVGARHLDGQVAAALEALRRKLCAGDTGLLPAPGTTPW